MRIRLDAQIIIEEAQDEEELGASGAAQDFLGGEVGGGAFFWCHAYGKKEAVSCVGRRERGINSLFVP